MEKQGNKIKRWLNALSRSVAAKLSTWINPLSTPAKKRGFLLIGICTAVACAMLIVRSVESEHASAALPVDTITRPADINPEENVSEQESEQIMIDQYNRMIYFKQLADRLSGSSGKRALDSLMKAHPGLRDSLKTFIKNYYSH
ncbi:MAG: hypothetical protein WD824_17835 [Cyclobacteriaceae bacterium]